MIINYYVFKEKGGDNTIDVIVEDGGVASSYKPDDHYRTDYYRKRIGVNTTIDTFWEELNEGEMQHAGDKWVDKDPSENELIDEMLNWLCISTEPIEFVRHDMGEMTKEGFEFVKSKLTLT